MTEVIMPKMGDGMEEGTLVEWTKKEGDAVKSGEVIGTIQTDKATLELEAPASGTLAGLLLKGGETVPVGQAIGVVLKQGEKLPEGWSSGTASAPAAKPEADSGEKAEADNEVPSSQPEEPVQAAQNGRAEEPASSDGRVKASPLARKIASEKGIDLAGVAGSGPGGRIVERDVREARTATSTSGPQVAPSAETKQVSLTKLRQITAQRTTESKQQVPHFYVTVEVDVEKILSLREMFEEEESGKVSVNDFVVKACTRALQEMPLVNSTFEGKTVKQFGEVHIGIAAAVDDGLTVPVLKNAHTLSLREISVRTKDLVRKARENKLGLDELQGSTFSITNMGMLNVDNFYGIINVPNAAILAVSTAQKKVVVNDQDELEVRTRMNISASFDHRVVDGAVGAQFINLVRDYLQNPSRLLS